MTVDELRKVAVKFAPPIQGPHKVESKKTEVVWETVTKKDLEKFNKDVEGELEKDDPPQWQEQDLCDALSLLQQAYIMLGEMADTDLTVTLTRMDRDNMEQLAGEIEVFVDQYDPEYIGAILEEEEDEV